MPDDRFIHRASGHSRKVNKLTSDEFRVWIQFQLSADDFGVMLFSSRPLRADNDYLDGKGTKTVQRWLERVRDVGLLLTFEHQDQTYCCQWDWQDWQGIEYPRPTIYPKPPADVLAQCDAATQLLFSVHPGGKRAPSLKALKDVSEDSPKDSQTFDHLAGAHARTAQAKATATAQASEGGVGETAIRPARGMGAGVMAGALPRDHFLCRQPCERVCLSEKQHAILRARHGGSDADLDAFYAEVRARLDPGVPIGEKPWNFWDNQFAARFGSAPAVGKTAGNIGAAARFVARGDAK